MPVPGPIACAVLAVATTTVTPPTHIRAEPDRAGVHAIDAPADWGPVVARHVRIERWRFDAIRRNDNLLAVVAWWDRAEDPTLKDTGGTAFPVVLYVLAEDPTPLGIAQLAGARPARPLSVAWSHDATWAYALIPAVMLMGRDHAQTYTDIPTGWYVSPDSEELPPSITPFPTPGDPLLTVHEGDAAEARAALDQIIAFLAKHDPDPTRAADRDRFNTRDATFTEIFALQPWTLVERSEPLDGTCSCSYGQPRPSVSWRSVATAPGERTASAMRTTRTELHTISVLESQPCPDAERVPAMIAESNRLRRAATPADPTDTTGP
jgi:hypothetical protein